MVALVLGPVLARGFLRFQHWGVRRPILGRKDEVAGLADDFRLRVAQHRLRAGAPTGDPALQVEGEDGVIPRAVDDQAQPFLRAAAQGVGGPALGHVHEGEHHAADAVLRRAVGLQVDEEPAAVVGAIHLALDGHERAQHGLGVDEEVG